MRSNRSSTSWLISPRLGRVPIIPYMAAERCGKPEFSPPINPEIRPVNRLIHDLGKVAAAALASLTRIAFPVFCRLGFLTELIEFFQIT